MALVSLPIPVTWLMMQGLVSAQFQLFDRTGSSPSSPHHYNQFHSLLSDLEQQFLS